MSELVADIPVRRVSDHTYFSMTKSLCRVCKKSVDAKVIIRDDAVWFDKFCPEHGAQEVIVASSVEWYLDCLTFLAPHQPPGEFKTDVVRGCPFDCGPCASHQQRVFLPTLPVSNQTKQNGKPHHLCREDLKAILGHLRDGRELDIINFSCGGFPLPPELPDFLAMCREAGVERLTVSTNGEGLRDEVLLRELSALDTRIVLSLDSLRGDQAVLELLKQEHITVTLQPTVTEVMNDDEVNDFFNVLIEQRHIVSLEINPGFSTGARITIPDLHQRLEAATGGRVVSKDFVPSPLAHPHCYSICYLLCLDDGGFVPFTRLASRRELFGLLEDSLYIEPREKMEAVFRGIIDSLWSEPSRLPESESVLKTVKRLLREMYPENRSPLSMTERRKIGERSIKAVYIHAHMDTESFDVSRVMKCCVGEPATDGTNVPVCARDVLIEEYKS